LIYINSSRRSGLFLARWLIAVLAVVVVILPIIDLARIVAAHSGLEVADAFAKAFGDLRYATRSEQDNDYQRYYQQLRHSKWTHVVLLKRVDSDETILALA